MVGDLHGDGFVEADESVFGGAVMAAHTESTLSSNGGDLHDVAALLFDHVGQDIATAQKGAFQLGVDDILPGLLVHLRNGDHGRVAGIVDQDIDLAEGIHHLSDHFFHVGGLAHITFDADRLDTHGFNALDGFIHARFGGHVVGNGFLIFADIGNGDIRPFFCQATGDGQTVAPCPPGDDGHLALKFHGDTPFHRFFIQSQFRISFL